MYENPGRQKNRNGFCFPGFLFYGKIIVFIRMTLNSE